MVAAQAPGVGAGGMPSLALAGEGTVAMSAEATAAAGIGAPPAHPAEPAGAMDLVGGLVGGAVAAVLATAVWYGVVAATQFQVGLVAVAVGWLVGQGVAYGAQRRFSIGLIPISVVLTVLALAISEYLIIVHFVSQEFGEAIPLIQPPDLIVEVITTSITSDPLTLVFWAIALFQAFVIPARLPRPTGAAGTGTGAPPAA